MTLQEKMQLLMREYSISDIARKLSATVGYRVPVSTVNAYSLGVNTNIRKKDVSEALDKLLEEYNEVHRL